MITYSLMLLNEFKKTEDTPKEGFSNNVIN